MARKIDSESLELEETIVGIRRVAKTVKGGRNMRFSVTMVVGNGQGYVGVGKGKAREIPAAAQKAAQDAKKNLVFIPTVGTTIPHRSLGVFGAGRVLLMPANEGTGVIAGGSVRTILELAGINDIRAKSIGSNNVFNMAYAAIDAIKKLKTVEKMASLRGKTKEEITGKKTHAASAAKDGSAPETEDAPAPAVEDTPPAPPTDASPVREATEQEGVTA